jgi:Caspase domain
MKQTLITSTTVICLFCGLLLSQPSWALQKDTIRRFALVVGANDGGRTRPVLRYAISDAKAITYLLQKIGGVFPIDCVFLVEPDRADFLEGFKTLQHKIRAAQNSAKKVEIIFYYSGHSDEEAVLLGSDKILYREIKKHIEKTPADVRIAILDSCSSGAFTRLKGGKMRPPFLMDSSNDMKGFAFLSSSSSDEASQESDRLKSSFFTHYLISGLRGAADLTQDGRVTLNEAYQYAYRETLVKTEKTLGGPQHPNYNIQMSGTGDVVMTDIRNSSAIMLLDKALQGRIFIRDEKDNVVLEMRKPAGRVMQIGLEDGTYLISNENNRVLYEAKVDLVLGQQFILKQDHFEEIEREHTVARGSVSQPPVRAKYNADGYKVVPWDLCLLPTEEKYGRTIHYYVFGLLGTYSAKLDGFAFSLGPNIVKEETRGALFSLVGNFSGGNMEAAQMAGLFNVCEQDMSGLQFSGLINITKGNVSGVQYGGILSLSEGNLIGAQSGGIFVLAEGDVIGAQMGGVFALSEGKVTGAQAGGIFALAEGKVIGAQMGVVFCSAGDLQGAQLSLVNIAEDVDGAQVGLINIAKEQRGVPVGLINLSENGSVDIIGWKDNLSMANIGVKFRANYFYSIISTSKRSFNASGDDGWGAGYHYGGHIPLKPFYVEIDLGFSVQNNAPTDRFDENDWQMAQARVMLGTTFKKRFSLFVGTGIAYMYRGQLIETEVESEIPGFRDYEYEFILTEDKWEPIYLAGASFSF